MSRIIFQFPDRFSNWLYQHETLYLGGLGFVSLLLTVITFGMEYFYPNILNNTTYLKFAVIYTILDIVLVMIAGWYAFRILRSVKRGYKHYLFGEGGCATKKNYSRLIINNNISWTDWFNYNFRGKPAETLSRIYHFE